MNIGVLGTGFGSYHAEIYSNLKEVDKIYVFGRKPEKLKELEDKFHVIGVENINDIMENREIDLVDICLPTSLHSNYAVQALEHGKHVFCETPIAYSLEEALAMEQAKIRYEKQLMVNLFLRFDPCYKTLTRLIAGKQYGELKKIQIQRYTPPFFGDLGPKKIVTDLMIHDIDFVTSLLGGTNSIQSTLTTGVDGQCAVSALCSYDQAFAEINGSSMMPLDYPFAVSYEAIFEKAVVRYYEDGYSNCVETKLTVFTETSREEIPIITDNSFENMMKEVLHYAIDMTKSNVQPINDVSEAKVSIAMALEIQRQILLS